MAKQSNIDKLIGRNVPIGSYALSGGVWNNIGEGAPMIINSHSPGVHHESWAATYGSSHDAFLSIVDGVAVEASIGAVSVTGVYKSIPNTSDDNIWANAGGFQQIQYIVSGSDIDDGRSRIDSFGSLSDARGLCIRLPMMACGYGKTIEMLPLAGDTRQNPDFVKTDRGFWRTGSIDLRWDNKTRGWKSYNDMIADKQGIGIGTAVHSTNDDEVAGFPYLKGRLQDVWWVRKTKALEAEDGKTDGSQSAEIMTHLKHKLFDEVQEGAASLDSVFIIPHKDLDPMGTPDVCHEKGEEIAIGGENTGVGTSIDIKSTAHFYKDKDSDGPIKFGNKLTDIGEVVCCENNLSKFFVGEMIFLDDQLDRCDDSVPEAGPPPCEWVPAVRIDECELVGGHFGTLVGNDIALARQISNLCIGINAWSANSLKTSIDSALATVAGGVGTACDQTVKVAEATTKALASLAVQLAVAFEEVQSGAEDMMTQLVESINAALVACGCEGGVQEPTVDLWQAHGDFKVPDIKATPCILTITGVAEFPCEECQLIEITAPCAENSDKNPFLAGSTCDFSPSLTPDYTGVGDDCQARNTGS